MTQREADTGAEVSLCSRMISCSENYRNIRRSMRMEQFYQQLSSSSEKNSPSLHMDYMRP